MLLRIVLTTPQQLSLWFLYHKRIKSTLDSKECFKLQSSISLRLYLFESKFHSRSHCPAHYSEQWHYSDMSRHETCVTCDKLLWLDSFCHNSWVNPNPCREGRESAMFPTFWLVKVSLLCVFHFSETAGVNPSSYFKWHKISFIT